MVERRSAASPARPISLDLRDVEDQSPDPRRGIEPPRRRSSCRDWRILVAAVDPGRRRGVGRRDGVLGDRRGCRSRDRAGLAAGVPCRRRTAPSSVRNAGKFMLEQLVPRMGIPVCEDPRVLRHRGRRLRALASPTRPAPRSRRAACTSAASPSTTPTHPNWAPVMQALAAAKPDILVLSSHIQDGIAFRRAFLAAGLGGQGVHGHDHGAVRPGLRQRPRRRARSASSPRIARRATSTRVRSIPQARSLYDRFAALWKQRTGRGCAGRGGDRRVHRRVGALRGCPRSGRG